MSIYRYMSLYRQKSNTIAIIRGRKKTSFPTLFKEIDRVAGGLYALGVRHGDVVMLALPNIEQAVVAVYAVSRIGAIISLIHPKIGKSEFKREYEKQKPKVVLLSDINLIDFGKIASNSKRVYCPYGMYVYIGLPYSKRFEAYDGDGQETAIYMHSGGTTGTPKTVVLKASAVNALVTNLLSTLDDKFDCKDTMLVTLPIFHGYGLCVGIHASLSTNMAVVLLPKFSSKKAKEAIEKHHISTMIAVPRILQKLLNRDDFCGKSIASLKEIYIGGDSLDSGLENDFNLRLKESGSTAVVSAGYGLSEVCGCCVVCHHEYRKNTVGRTLQNVESRIVDEQMNTVAINEMGELLLAGYQLMSGYLGDNNEIEEACVTIDGKKWLKTGDLFLKDNDSFLTFLGRKKRLIKISGMNVFPSEIERIARELDCVGECVAVECVIGGKVFIKLLVDRELSDKEKGQVKLHIAHNLSHWHIPELVVSVENFPRTNLGKIDFVRLQNEHREN